MPVEAHAGFPVTNAPLVRDNGQVNIPWYQFFIRLWNRTGGTDGVSNVGITGEIRMFAGSSVLHDAWIFCDGRAVSRTTYGALFTVIGTIWGIGDGVTTFNVPNLVDRFIIGAGNLYGLGATGGADSQTLSATAPGTATDFLTPPKYAALNYYIKN